MDLQFWAARNAPSWARTMLKYPPNPGALLHAAINFRGTLARKKEIARHAMPGKRIRFDKYKDHNYNEHLEKGNAIAVLGMARRRGADVYLHMIEVARAYKHVQPERANTYNRWLRRMEQR
jgi:hypothetical protein